MIIITSRAKEGFRRAGRAHQAGRTEWPEGSFTPKQMAELDSEPLFVVDDIDEPTKPPAKLAKKDA